MHNNTSPMLGLAIATILIAYILTLTLSNQAFAQGIGLMGQPASNSGQIGHTLTKLAGQTTKSVLGDVCLSCWGGLAAHETQQANELAGELSGHAPGQQGQTTTGTGNLGSTAPIYIFIPSHGGVIEVFRLSH